MQAKKTLVADSLKSRMDRLLLALRTPAVAVFFGLLVGGIVILWSGGDPFEGILSLIYGGFGSAFNLTTTLTRATPIIYAGLAAALAWGSGYESMGIAGQMTLGAFAAAITAVYCPGPPLAVILAAMLAGMATGALYSLAAAWISARFQVYLLIVTLMMNYVAENIASYLTTYVFRDPNATDNLAIQTQKIEAAILPRLFGNYTVHTGFLIALGCVGAVLFMVKKTSFGYDARMSGLNPRFARYGGVNSRRNMYLVLALNGALAGLGGACEVLGTRYRFIDKMITSPSYAWSGITAALMSNNHPLGILASAIFLAGLTTGGATIERNLNIPREITAIIQGVLTIFVTAQFFVNRRRRKKAAKGTDKGAEGGQANAV
jgi:simple sugar transport system permease protein